MKQQKHFSRPLLILFTLLLSLALTGCDLFAPPPPPITLDAIPEYSGQPYVQLEDGVPTFTEEELSLSSFESYAPLDLLERCGTAFALVGPETMPTEERGAIGQVKPSGWHTVRYDDLVDGKYLYNRCHLIGYQLTGENANEQNLITGTRYLNIDGMLSFENAVADYVEETGNHVLYRVTPVFEGLELVARGLVMEGYSVEDDGEGICFYIYAYNVQPGVTIDYLTGESWRTEDGAPSSEDSTEHSVTYILNTSSMKFHSPDCSGVKTMKEENRQTFSGTREEVVAAGYSPCGTCKP